MWLQELTEPGIDGGDDGSEGNGGRLGAGKGSGCGGDGTGDCRQSQGEAMEAVDGVRVGLSKTRKWRSFSLEEALIWKIRIAIIEIKRKEERIKFGSKKGRIE